MSGRVAVRLVGEVRARRELVPIFARDVRLAQAGRDMRWIGRRIVMVEAIPADGEAP